MSNPENTASLHLTGIHAFAYFRVQSKSVVNWLPPVEKLAKCKAYLPLKGYADVTARLYVIAIRYKCKIKGILNTTTRLNISKCFWILSALKTGWRIG